MKLNSDSLLAALGMVLATMLVLGFFLLMAHFARKAKTEYPAIIDSVRVENQNIQAIITQRDETILDLRERIVRDSVQHLDAMQSIRAINAYIESSRQRRDSAIALQRQRGAGQSGALRVSEKPKRTAEK